MTDLVLLPDTFAVCRLDRNAPIPTWACIGSFVSLTRTDDELSIVVSQRAVPDGIACIRGWRCLKVEGPLDLSSIGILAALVTPLAEAGISIFALATYETDYLLVKDEALDRAIQVLSRAGRQVRHASNT